MMELIILPLQFKTFNMKLYFIILSFFLVGYANAQIMPQTFISNNNAYPTSLGANASFDIESATSGLAANTYPAIKSDFSFNFTNTTPSIGTLPKTKDGALKLKNTQNLPK